MEERSATNSDEAYFIDFNNIFYTPAFAAGCLGLTPRRLAGFEEEHGIEIRRVPRGSVTSRVYRPADIFQIAALRRSLGLTKGLDRQIVISTFIQKGGTAKTTAAVDFAIYAQLAGMRVLIIDNDPQGDASCMLGYDPDLSPEDLAEFGIPADRIVDAHIGNLISPTLRMQPFPARTLEQVIKKPFGEDGPHIIPSDASLEDLGSIFDASNAPDMRYLRWLDSARQGKIEGCDLSKYDLIIIDNAPAGSRLTKNSVAASDILLCPIRMEKFSFRALLRLHDWCARFASEYQFSPSIVAIPTMFIRNRDRVYRSLDRINQLFPGAVTQGKIHASEDYEKSKEDGIPLLFWKKADPRTRDDARTVYREVLDKAREVAKNA